MCAGCVSFLLVFVCLVFCSCLFLFFLHFFVFFIFCLFSCWVFCCALFYLLSWPILGSPTMLCGQPDSKVYKFCYAILDITSCFIMIFCKHFFLIYIRLPVCVFINSDHSLGLAWLKPSAMHRSKSFGKSNQILPKT